MRRVSLYIGILFLTFVCGVVATAIVHPSFLSGHRTAVQTKELPSDTVTVPRFVPVGSILDPDYHIYWYRTPSSNDPEQISLYGDFRSAQVTRENFESNATTDAARLLKADLSSI